MQALRKAEDANVELSGAKRRARAAFGSSRALENSGTGTMLSARRSRFFASGSRRARPLLRPEERSSITVAFSAQPSNSSRTSGKAFGEDAGAQKSRRRQCGALRSQVPGAGGFRQQPSFGEHRHRHNAQCAKKPLLRLREPESTAAAETSRTKKHNSGILCAALKLIKDAPRCIKLDERQGNCWVKFSVPAQFLLVRKSGKAFGEDSGAQKSRRRQCGALRSQVPGAGGFRQQKRFGEQRHRHNAQCAKKPLLRLRQPESAAAAET
ncbi:unnamed protein product [Coccothraustes coccothraustes]